MKTTLELAQEFIAQHRDIKPTCNPMPDNESNPIDWILKHSRVPWLKLQGIDVPYQEMLREARALRHRFVDHRGDNGTGWLSLCIHGISAEHTNSAASYGLSDNSVKYDWTDIQDQCPVTVDFFRNRFHYVRYQRVRFMLLQSGGHIEPHQDADTYYVASAVNMSLCNPPGCTLTTTQGTVPFEDSGSMFYFNTSFQHAAHNPSDQDRFHIIVHGQPDMRIWNDIILNSYKEQVREFS